MERNISLGRIAGISVQINWSVLIIAALVTLGTAGGVLPAAVPGLSGISYLIGGLLAAGLLLVSILMHEMGHALVARRHGVHVERISLWAFGGIAQLKGEADSPKAEAQIAGVGPAVSVGVGAALFAIATTLSGLPAAVIGWTAFINLLLAVFNLIPGAPLDGGRLLHAWLWSRHGDRLRATRTAGKAGRLVGAILIALGLFQVISGGLGGLWTIFIGWFLRNAAGSETTYAELKQDLAGITARDIMIPVQAVSGDWLSVGTFVERYAASSFKPLYALTEPGGATTGIVTVEALAAVPEDSRWTTSVRNVARPITDVPSVQADQPASELLQTLGSETLMTVVDGEEVIGTITPAELTTAAGTARLLGMLRGGRPEAA